MPKLSDFPEGTLPILAQFGFQQINQRGSHAKLRRVLPGNLRQTLTIPVHDELDTGTLRAIYRQALRFIPENELKSTRFWTSTIDCKIGCA